LALPSCLAQARDVTRRGFHHQVLINNAYKAAVILDVQGDFLMRSVQRQTMKSSILALSLASLASAAKPLVTPVSTCSSQVTQPPDLQLTTKQRNPSKSKSGWTICSPAPSSSWTLHTPTPSATASSAAARTTTPSTGCTASSSAPATTMSTSSPRSTCTATPRSR
jgi:hypothetical protein